MELGYILVTLGWQAPMLSGEISKALEPSPQCLARHLGKQHRQDRKEQHGDDRGEHRGASRGAGGTRFLPIQIPGCCWQLIDSHLHRKLAAKVGENVGC